MTTEHGAPLELTREQILGHRRRAGDLDRRLPMGEDSLRRAAFVGLTDSMPRAALLSIHARVEDARPSSWHDEPLAQVWGPRFSAYVVARDDVAIFTRSRLSDHPRRRARAIDMADRLEALLGGGRMSYADAGHRLGVNPNDLRYAAPTGRVLIHWEGAGRPTIWTVPEPPVDPAAARIELVRRYVHVFGPATPASFEAWAGIRPPGGVRPFETLGPALVPVRTPIGEGWILASDEESFRSEPDAPAPARLLPSGDAYFLLWNGDRELLVPSADRRGRLWTSRVWPGAMLVRGEIVGTWRRAGHRVVVEPWQRFENSDRDAVEAEAASLPLPELGRRIAVDWRD